MEDVLSVEVGPNNRGTVFKRIQKFLGEPDMRSVYQNNPLVRGKLTKARRCVMSFCVNREGHIVHPDGSPTRETVLFENDTCDFSKVLEKAREEEQALSRKKND